MINYNFIHMMRLLGLLLITAAGCDFGQYSFDSPADTNAVQGSSGSINDAGEYRNDWNLDGVPSAGPKGNANSKDVGVNTATTDIGRVDGSKPTEENTLSDSGSSNSTGMGGIEGSGGVSGTDTPSESKQTGGTNGSESTGGRSETGDAGVTGSTGGTGDVVGAGDTGVSCEPGFDDCNGSIADGCETDIRTNISHCGECDNACPSPLEDHALWYAVCESSTCGVRCTESTTLCDSHCIPSGTCCTDSDCDVLNHETCSRPGESCSCADGYKDCNGNCISIDTCCPGVDEGDYCAFSGKSGRCTRTGACVECLQEIDCETKGLHCLTTTGQCVVCRSDEDCSDLQSGICNSGHQCVYGSP